MSEGKEILRRKMKQMKIPFDQSNLEKISDFFGYKTPTEFYFHLGTGKIDHVQIKKYKPTEEKGFRRRILQKIMPSSSKVEKTKTTDLKSIPDHLLIGDDMDKLDYKLAKCCNPIAGDDVFGFVTVNEGIKVHRTNCPNAAELLSNHGYRVLKAKWASSDEKSFLATLKVIGTDRIGIISDLSNLISSQMKVNMRSMSINTNNGIFEGNIDLFVDDTSQLDYLLKKLEEIDGVVNVSRHN